ncbi:NUDIX domain-containing protein [Micromonospora sp. NPDC049240]|uniref:NUDIX hydrolase n=1 Tax=Micromonospora sp. NPDC049240 TaxID=3155151 RepID=UPI0033FC70DA
MAARISGSPHQAVVDRPALPVRGQGGASCVRKTKEESGVDVEVTGILGNPKHIMAYSDGKIRQQFSICFRARYLGGETTPSSESSEVRWVAKEDLDTLPIHPSMRVRIKHEYEGPPHEPYIG